MESVNNNEVTANAKSNIEVNYSQYKDSPESVLPIANQFFNKKQFEEGLNLIEKGIEFAVIKYSSEACIQLAQFYDKYGEGLIRKLLENDDILAIPKGNIEVEQLHEDIKNENDNHKGDENLNDDDKNNNNNNEINDNNDEEDPPEDEQIAYENLMAANTLYTTFLKNYDMKSPSELSQEIIKYYLKLADNYMLFGELETAKSDYAQAHGYYSKAANLRIKYDEKYSRCLAECYFKQASVLDYDPKKCLLSFFKTKAIMEYHLKQKLANHPTGKDIIIDFSSSDLDLMELNEESNRIYVNRNAIESESMRQFSQQDEEIGNLVDIINDLNLKIEDVITELKEYDRYISEKKHLNTKNEFTENYDKEKVIDISNTLVKKKRPRSPIANSEEMDNLDKGVKVKKVEKNNDLNP